MKKTLLLLLLPVMAMAQQTREFSLVTYNSLRYSPSNIDARHPHFRRIMNDLQPDLLVMQELSGFNSADLFLDSVLNRDSSTYALANFIDGNDMDVALFYKSQKFSSLQANTYPTSLRDIFEFQLLPAGGDDTLYIFGLHLKASSGSSNQARRASEVAVLRSVTNQLADSTDFIVCGDFNIYGSSEAAYQDLLKNTPGNQGHFVDKISMSGTWNNASYAQYHTQSPRTTQFNGGAHGGMDDRFDMILISEALEHPGDIDFIAGSMKVYGNDGQHYNKSIIDAPINSEVSPAIANALHQASDHLPVIARFRYELASQVGLAEANPFELRIGYSQSGAKLWNPQARPLEVHIYNLAGQRLRQFFTSGSDYLELAEGAYLVEVRNPSTQEPVFTGKVIR